MPNSQNRDNENNANDNNKMLETPAYEIKIKLKNGIDVVEKFLSELSEDDKIKIISGFLSNNAAIIKEYFSKLPLLNEQDQKNLGRITEHTAGENGPLSEFSQLLIDLTLKKDGIPYERNSVATYRILTYAFAMVNDADINIRSKHKMLSELYKNSPYTPNLFIEYEERVKSLNKSKTAGAISLSEFESAMKSGKIDYSDHILLVLGLIQTISAKKGNEDIQKVVNDIHNDYMNIKYEDAIKKITHLFSDESFKTRLGSKVSDAVNSSLKNTTDIKEVEIKRNFSRRFLENRIASLFYDKLEKSDDIKKSISNITSRLLGPSYSEVTSLPSAIRMITSLAFHAGGAIRERSMDLKKCSDLYKIKDRRDRKDVNIFPPEDESNLPEDAKVESIWSFSAGSARAEQRNWRDEYSDKILRNKNPNAISFVERDNNYPLTNKRSPFVGSLSGHVFHMVAQLEHYMQNTPDFDPDDINNFIKSYIAVYMGHGYHSYLECIHVLREPAVARIFKENNVELKLDWDPALLAEAFKDTQYYTKTTLVISSSERELTARSDQLFNAIGRNDQDAVNALYKKYPHLKHLDMNQTFTNSKGETLLFVAAREGNLDALNHFLNQKIDIDITNNEGDNVIQIALKNDHVNIITALLANKPHDIPLIVSLIWNAARIGSANILDDLLKKYPDLSFTGQSESTPMFMAAQNGNLNAVKVIIDNKGDINRPIDTGVTPLAQAAMNGHFDIVKLLIENGGYINSAAYSGTTPLWFASQNGHISIVELLLKNGAKIDATATADTTPLWMAAQNGHFSIVELLANNGANINATSDDGKTPLMIAAQMGHLNTVKYLLSKGVDMSAKSKTDADALSYALEYGQTNIVSFLLKNGARLDSKDIHDKNKNHTLYTTIRNAILENPEKLNTVITNKGETLIDIAIIRDDTKAIKALLSKGQLIDIKSIKISDFIINNSGKLGQDFLEKCIDMGFDINSRNSSGDSVLHVAAEEGDENLIQMLLDLGADINLPSAPYGETPLMAAKEYGRPNNFCKFIESKGGTDRSSEIENLIKAIKNGDTKQCQDIIKNHLDINTRAKNGEIPIIVAIQTGQHDIVKLLLANKAGIKKEYGDNKLTALHIAIENKQFDIAGILLEQGADLTAKATDGSTALSIAKKNNDYKKLFVIAEKYCGEKGVIKLFFEAIASSDQDFINYILAKGINVNSTNEPGQSALSHAVESGNLEVVNLLLKSGANFTTDIIIRNPIRKAVSPNIPDSILERLLKEPDSKNHINTKNRLGATPLWASVSYEMLEKTKLLLANGADVNITNNHNITPLHKALETRNIALINLLLAYNADINLKDDNNRTPLTMAMESGNAEIIELIQQSLKPKIEVSSTSDLMRSLSTSGNTAKPASLDEISAANQELKETSATAKEQEATLANPKESILTGSIFNRPKTEPAIPENDMTKQKNEKDTLKR